MQKKSVDTPMIREFIEFYEGLTYDLIPYSSAHERLRAILPKLPGYLNKLSKEKSGLFKIVVERMVGACQYAYERGDWDGFVSLSLHVNNKLLDHGDYRLVYVHNSEPFHESVAWLLTKERDERKRKPIPYLYDDKFSEPDWIKEEIFSIVEPAKLYNRWHDIEEDKPVEQFKSVDEILEYGENLNGNSYLVFPKARIKGLSISDSEIEETPFNIQNWFGDEALMVSRLPKNHYLDT